MSKKRYNSLRQLADIGLISTKAVTDLEPTTTDFAIGITEHVVSKIAHSDDPIYRQFVPDRAELAPSEIEQDDPIGDTAHSPVTGIIHRYPDRCLLLPIRVCATYCRFCFRKKLIGPGTPSLSAPELEQALAYIRAHKEIWEVIFSGGDPLLLSARQLQSIITALNDIPHIGIIRLHSRIPVVAPERLTAEVLAVLKQSRKPVYLAIHANHSQEFNDVVASACQNLRASGVTLLGQSVLLKDINDSTAALEDLFKTFLVHHIKPYYLHHCDLAPGTRHFRVPIATGQALLKELRGKISGLCLPTYMLDIPGGYGKVPIGPTYLAPMPSSEQYTVQDISGTTHPYTDV